MAQMKVDMLIVGPCLILDFCIFISMYYKCKSLWSGLRTFWHMSQWKEPWITSFVKQHNKTSLHRCPPSSLELYSVSPSLVRIKASECLLTVSHLGWCVNNVHDVFFLLKRNIAKFSTHQTGLLVASQPMGTWSRLTKWGFWLCLHTQES